MPELHWPTWLIHHQCSFCSGRQEAPGFCQQCRHKLELNGPAPHGGEPLRWRALSHYGGTWRQLIWTLRRKPKARLIRALAVELAQQLPHFSEWAQPCPIPPRQGHPKGPPQWLAGAVSQRSGWPQATLLQRHRACLGQHHLNRQQRAENLRGVFAAAPAQNPNATVLLIDDVRTSGATGQAAAEALQQAGYTVLGLLCLSSTPIGGCGDGLSLPLAQQGLPG